MSSLELPILMLELPSDLFPPNAFSCRVFSYATE